MIARLDLARASPEQKAELIYNQARSDLSSRLWRAALGAAEARGEQDGTFEASLPEGGLDLLLSLIGEQGHAGPAVDVRPAVVTFPNPAPGDPVDQPRATVAPSDAPAGLGVNARHAPALESAARRTGIPAQSLAAIVNAEAAKGPDGGWKLFSRNPRSSAAGLGQFLSGTWIAEAERSGTWLNSTARARGWLGESGRVLGAARSELLALRYDGEASINAIADYARANLDRLRKSGVTIENSVESTARAAYLGHHLGLGDAIRFLKGGLDPTRARKLLHAQIGSADAERRIAEAGSASAAHRTWLIGYVERNIRPNRFGATA